LPHVFSAPASGHAVRFSFINHPSILPIHNNAPITATPKPIIIVAAQASSNHVPLSLLLLIGSQNITNTTNDTTIMNNPPKNIMSYPSQLCSYSRGSTL